MAVLVFKGLFISLFLCLFVCFCKVNALFVFHKHFVNFFAKDFSTSSNKQTFNEVMKGSDLKELLRREGIVLNQLAEALEMSQQNLSAAFTRDDVKSGLLEKIARAIDKPVGFFYGEVTAPVQSAVGDNNTQVGGNYQGSDPAVLELLKMKDEQLTLAIKQVSKAQEQMDRVLDRFCRPEKAEGSGEV